MLKRCRPVSISGDLVSSPASKASTASRPRVHPLSSLLRKTRVLCGKPEGLGPVSKPHNNTPSSPEGLRRGAPSRLSTQEACFSIPTAGIQAWVEDKQLREGRELIQKVFRYKVFKPNTKQHGALSLFSTKGPSGHAYCHPLL